LQENFTLIEKILLTLLATHFHTAVAIDEAVELHTLFGMHLALAIQQEEK
jgi:Ni,Fe-hydrogenase III component G